LVLFLAKNQNDCKGSLFSETSSLGWQKYFITKKAANNATALTRNGKKGFI